MSTKLLVAVAAVLLGVLLVAVAAASGTLGSSLEWSDVVVSGLAAAAFGGAVAWRVLHGRRP